MSTSPILLFVKVPADVWHSGTSERSCDRPWRRSGAAWWKTTASSRFDDAKYSVCIAGQGMDRALQFELGRKKREGEGRRERGREASSPLRGMFLYQVYLYDLWHAPWTRRRIYRGSLVFRCGITEMEEDTTEKEHRSVSARWMHERLLGTIRSLGMVGGWQRRRVYPLFLLLVALENEDASVLQFLSSV